MIPAVSVNFFATDFYYWMWGFVIFKTYPPFVPEEYTGLTTNISQLIMLSTIALLIFISAIVLMITAIILIKNRKYSRVIENLWLVSALLSIGATIFWIIWVESPTGGSLTPMPPGYQFWNIFSPNFGIIAPFISGGLSIAGMATYRHFMKEERDVIVLEEKGPK